MAKTKLSVREAAQLLGVGEQWVRDALIQNLFPWGYALKRKKWSFYINAQKFYEAEGFKIEEEENH